MPNRIFVVSVLTAVLGLGLLVAVSNYSLASKQGDLRALAVQPNLMTLSKAELQNQVVYMQQTIQQSQQAQPEVAVIFSNTVQSYVGWIVLAALICAGVAAFTSRLAWLLWALGVGVLFSWALFGGSIPGVLHRVMPIMVLTLIVVALVVTISGRKLGPFGRAQSQS